MIVDHAVFLALGRGLEAAAWDLQAAMQAYMPPVPDSPVAGRKLSTSNFKVSYGRVQAPEGPMDLGAELAKLIGNPLYPYLDPQNPDPSRIAPFMLAGRDPYA